ncbi:MAG: biotin synthase BioB [Gammaproteobacteria bacterium]|nr:biotin synthase BioB [Gammaproteobacteria bacterium]
MIKNTWKYEEVVALFQLPFNDLIFRAHTIHREHFDPNKVQISTLSSIKTGRCAENCGYCSQSAHFDTGLESEALVAIDSVIEDAKQAKKNGADRFCMGAAWSRPNKRDFPIVLEMIKGVKALDMEACVTLGMLDSDQVAQLKDAGLDYYNHNIDTSPEYYDKIVTTRSFQDRLDTISKVRASGINVCSGAILGMGESEKDRISLLIQLANMDEHPDSVPINMLVPIEGTPLYNSEKINPIDFIKTVAIARIMMPATWVRLSAGREEMSDEMQALCYFVGANSIFYGERLLTTDNASQNHDKQLLQQLGINSLMN